MSFAKGSDTMAKEQFTPEELEHIQGKELPQSIQYLYMCNQRSISEEITIFVCKWLISVLFIVMLFMFFPQITDFIVRFWELITKTNGTAY